MEDEISPVSLRKRNVTRKAEGTNKTCNEGDPRENGDRSSNISESLKGHVSGNGIKLSSGKPIMGASAWSSRLVGLSSLRHLGYVMTSLHSTQNSLLLHLHL